MFVFFCLFDRQIEKTSFFIHSHFAFFLGVNSEKEEKGRICVYKKAKSCDYFSTLFVLKI